jgi:hypothetical protein
MVRIRPELHPQAPGGPHREPNLAREDADLGISDFAETLARDLALLDVCDTARNESEIFGDGDKSFIRDARKRRQFRQNLCAYLNVSGKIASTEVSPFWAACFTGDSDTVDTKISEAKESPTALTQLLERREAHMRASPLIAVTYGARNLVENGMTRDFVKTARSLLAAGANVNARDVSGNTNCSCNCSNTNCS